jgi:hypothetical protein
MNNLQEQPEGHPVAFVVNSNPRKTGLFDPKTGPFEQKNALLRPQRDMF